MVLILSRYPTYLQCRANLSFFAYDRDVSILPQLNVIEKRYNTYTGIGISVGHCFGPKCTEMPCTTPASTSMSTPMPLVCHGVSRSLLFRCAGNNDQISTRRVKVTEPLHLQRDCDALRSDGAFSQSRNGFAHDVEDLQPLVAPFRHNDVAVQEARNAQWVPQFSNILAMLQQDFKLCAF